MFSSTVLNAVSMWCRLIVLIPLCVLGSSVDGARILGIFPVAARSHYILGNALMKGLAEAGHNVTVISPYEEKNPPKEGSYRDVTLIGFAEEFDKLLNQMNLLDHKNQSMFNALRRFFNITTKMNDDFYSNENVKKFLKSGETFDVIIVEQFLVDTVKIFGHIYKVPVIAFSSMGANPWINNMVGNPYPLSYISPANSGTSEHMSFFGRVRNVFMHLVSKAMDYFIYFPNQNQILKKHFTNPPDIYDLFYNVSLVLLNSHESLNQPVPYVPKMVQIAGFHINPPKKLPKDLQSFLDDAHDGAVYFSLGSNLKSKSLPPHKRDAFLTALGKLKQKVLWKWEDEDLPGKPPNVKIGKWLPQQDILAHPNVKLFITHCGLLSTTETIYHGVPILAIPVFADQHRNADIAVRSGYALSLPYEDLSFSEEKLSEMLQELLTNPQYSNNAKKRSQLFHDRPMKPMDAAVYWVEHVIRTKGAHQLGVAGVRIPWFIYHSLDVVSFIVITFSLSIYLLYAGIRKIVSCRRTCHKRNDKKKIN